jgi:hypothetical protein
MKQVHVECKPDELVVSKIGFQRKFITHYPGKSRVFKALGKAENQLAVVDEDPGSVKNSYEKSLKFIEESEGIKYYSDKSGNKIFILQGKLEDWVINICNKYNIKISSFGLPEKANDFHDVIIVKLSNFEKLLNELLEKKNPAILKLKSWLN